MRDKGVVFEEMRRIRRTLGYRVGWSWIEMTVGAALLAFAVAASMVR